MLGDGCVVGKEKIPTRGIADSCHCWQLGQLNILLQSITCCFDVTDTAPLAIAFFLKDGDKS